MVQGSSRTARPLPAPACGLSPGPHCNASWQDRAADFCPIRAVCKVGPCLCRQLKTDPRLGKRTGLDLFSVWSRSAMLAPAGSVLAMPTLRPPRNSVGDSGACCLRTTGLDISKVLPESFLSCPLLELPWHLSSWVLNPGLPTLRTPHASYSCFAAQARPPERAAGGAWPLTGKPWPWTGILSPSHSEILRSGELRFMLTFFFFF
ncbi:uncharacterized protein LOC104008032 [Pan troglodytes]|uniref:uncharacterized protein LOC104008032 n=1 Tax=Pan troglodytes TaxID=9598 RepID=UPI0023F19A4B|nr:uncharacterized protein LOC104008032 [Pan troglodytes]